MSTFPEKRSVATKVEWLVSHFRRPIDVPDIVLCARNVYGCNMAPASVRTALRNLVKRGVLLEVARETYLYAEYAEDEDGYF